MCHIKVPQMRTTTIRELKHATTAVLARVADGEVVEVQRRGEPVAVLVPPRRRAPIRRPDFVGRLKSVYGKRVLTTTGTDLVSESRGER
jgi:prevent-host-death family protein